MKNKKKLHLIDFERIDKICDSKMILQKDFCKNIGITIQGYNNAKHAGDVKASLLRQISLVLDVSMETLFMNAYEQKNTKNIVSESEIIYKSENIIKLEDKVKLLEEKIRDKEKIIELKEELIEIYKSNCCRSKNGS